MTPDPSANAKSDFFVSYTGADEPWAEWITYELEANGFSCVFQKWDFRPGSNFVLEMHEGAKAERTIAVLSPAYLQKPFPAPEWAAAFANDPEGVKRKLVPVRVEECLLDGLLTAVTHIDLVGLDEAAAAKKLLDGVRLGRAKPTAAPVFPGAAADASPAEAPPFPGKRTRVQPLVFGGAMPAANGVFTGRAALLEDVHASLAPVPERSTALTQTAVHGLAGIGKTSVAREYVHRFGPYYAGVWWLAAETREGLVSGLAALAARLDPRLAEGADAETASRWALSRVEESHPPFLLIYDNVPAPGALAGLMPARGARVLLTTRWADWSGQAREILLGALEEEEAVEFLQTRAGRSEPAGARRLARKLGCLPLALDHAGAYVRRAVVGFDTYAERAEELIARAPSGAPYPASVAATFDLAITLATRDCPAAEMLLSFFALLAPDRITLDLVDDATLPEAERSDALAALTVVSLAQPDSTSTAEAPSVSVHQLVQAVARTRMAARGATDTVLERAVARLAEVFPAGAFAEAQSWPECERLLPHALALREHARRQGHSSFFLPVLLGETAAFLHGRGSLLEAEPIHREAVAISKRVMERENPMALVLRSNLAILLYDAGRLAEAEPLLREAVGIGQRVLGSDNPSLLMWKSSLAALLTATGRFAEAEPLHWEAVQTGERVLGRKDRRVLMWRNNLANLLHDTGRLTQAEPFYREAVEIGRHVLGREHVLVMAWVNNLAILLHDTGRLAQAEPFLREALEAGERVLGREHPTVGMRRNNLARLLRATGRHEEADVLYR